ncbi:MAG: ABC transporter permease [Chloroflexi bacterium]|nr:ABC transporter permease [Chloroflexota bacterium]
MLYLFVTVVFAFLILPNFIVIPLSVTDSIFLQFPPRGFTWRWYQDYFGVEGASHFGSTGRWIPATIISVELAIAVMFLAVPIGALASYGLARGRYRGKSILNALIISPLIVPILITAIALFFFLSNSLRSFFKPIPGPNLPAGGEWALLIAGLALGIIAIAIMLGPKFYKKPQEEWDPRLLAFYDRFSFWAPFVLAATLFFFLILWFSSTFDKFDGGLFSPGDPIPKIPMVGPGLLIAHTMLAVPYVVIILTATLRSVDLSQDQASAILGANPFTTLRRVVLPAMIPGLAAAAFFSFLVSFDELLIALFLSTSQISTLPKEIWDGIRTEISPTIAAVATMLVLLTVIMLGVAFFVQTKMRAKQGAT